MFFGSDKYSDSNQINQKSMSNNKAGCFEEIKQLKKELALVKQERNLPIRKYTHPYQASKIASSRSFKQRRSTSAK